MFPLTAQAWALPHCLPSRTPVSFLASPVNRGRSPLDRSSPRLRWGSSELHLLNWSGQSLFEAQPRGGGGNPRPGLPHQTTAAGGNNNRVSRRTNISAGALWNRRRTRVPGASERDARPVWVAALARLGYCSTSLLGLPLAPRRLAPPSPARSLRQPAPELSPSGEKTNSFIPTDLLDAASPALSRTLSQLVSIHTHTPFGRQLLGLSTGRSSTGAASPSCQGEPAPAVPFLRAGDTCIPPEKNNCPPRSFPPLRYLGSAPPRLI